MENIRFAILRSAPPPLPVSSITTCLGGATFTGETSTMMVYPARKLCQYSHSQDFCFQEVSHNALISFRRIGTGQSDSVSTSYLLMYPAAAIPASSLRTLLQCNLISRQYMNAAIDNALAWHQTSIISNPLMLTSGCRPKHRPPSQVRDTGISGCPRDIQSLL